MTPIGGFFELETSSSSEPSPHAAALKVNSGRGCLTIVLEKTRPDRVWVPFYSCSSVIEPLQALGIAFGFYGIDSNLDPILPVMSSGEMLLYINYFGLKSATATKLAQDFPGQVIVDNTQAFFEGATPNAWTFNSARKFFGVADGAYLYGPDAATVSADLPENHRQTGPHLLSRLQGHQQLAFEQFQAAEALFDWRPLQMTSASQKILQDNVAYGPAASARRENFSFLDRHLCRLNKMSLNPSPAAAPFMYPYLPEKKLDRQLFYKQQIFLPTLWLDCVNRENPEFRWERRLSTDLLALPIDHRYGEEQMRFIVEICLRGGT